MKKYCETGSHQASTLKGFAVAWRQRVQLNFYRSYFYKMICDGIAIGNGSFVIQK